MSPPERGLLRLLSELRIELRILNDRVAAASGLKPRDLDVLDVIDHEGPCTPKLLSERTGLHPATLTGVLSRLERDGWIGRDRSPSDGRSAMVTSTARFDELRASYTAGDARIGAFSRALGADELAVIETFLREATEAARTAAAGLRSRGTSRGSG